MGPPLGSNAFHVANLMARMRNSETTTQELGGYLEVFLYRAPKRNHDAIAQNLMKFESWLEKNGVKIECYQFNGSEPMEGMESIAKTLSTAEDEDIWIELQYFRDRENCVDVYSRMMQDKQLKILGDEFFGPVSQGKSLVTGGFSRLGQ